MPPGREEAQALSLSYFSPQRQERGKAGVEVGGNAFWALLAVGLGYYVICEALTGMTVGKRMVGIRVVDENGEHLSLAAAVIRNALASSTVSSFIWSERSSLLRRRAASA